VKYCVTRRDEKILGFLLDEGGHAVEIHADRTVDAPGLGDIYIGRVEKVARAVGAVFVTIVPGLTGYLPAEEIVGPIFTAKGPSPEIQQGDELVVQISREAFGGKLPSLTTKLTLRGQCLVLEAGGMGIGVSRKLPEAERSAIREELLSAQEWETLQQETGPCGLVVRTNARTLGREKCLKELRRLSAELRQIRMTAPYRTVFSALHREPPRWLRRLESLPAEKTEAILTEDPDLYRAMQEFLAEADAGGADSRSERAADAGSRTSDSEKSAQSAEKDTGVTSTAGKGPADTVAAMTNTSATNTAAIAAKPMRAGTPAGENRRDSGGPDGGLSGRLRLYEDKLLPLDRLMSLERELTRAVARRVELRSGAFLYVESTQALHTIDVNSGRSEMKRDREEARLKVNLEAARAAAAQIRLRNLSGIIIIDFINMDTDESREALMEELRRAVAADPVRTQVVDRTKLGLVELTRLKKEAPLAEQLTETST